MNLLLVHNYYLQPGGEDTVFEFDVELLRNKGHNVVEYVEKNARIASMSPAKVAKNTIWSGSSYRKIFDILSEYRPDIVQFYNTFPLISASAYYACQKFGIPVIQYLFNPRLICPSANLYRNQKLCTDCVGKFLLGQGLFIVVIIIRDYILW